MVVYIGFVGSCQCFSSLSSKFQAQKLPILDKCQETPTLIHSADHQSAIIVQICASGRQRPDKTAYKLYPDRAPKKTESTSDIRERHFCFGVRIRLGTILGRFSIIYFRGLGLRVRAMVWVRVGVGVGIVVLYGNGKFRVRVRIRVGFGL